MVTKIRKSLATKEDEKNYTWECYAEVDMSLNE